MRAAAATVLLLGCLWPCACGSSLPDRFTFTDGSNTVEVTRSPYGYVLRDSRGKTVLRTLGDGAHDGYGALGYSAGSVEWGNIATLGYFSMTPHLDGWQDQWRVVEATPGAGRLDVVLESPDGARQMTVAHVFEEGHLRVDARASNDAPRVFAAAFATSTTSAGDESFIGFGERFNRVDQRGHAPYAWPEEGGLSRGEKQPASAGNPFPNGEEMTYYPVPFFLSTAGYGFWLNSTWRNQFDLGTDKPDAWRVWHIGPTLSYEVFLPSAPGKDARPAPLQLIDAFTRQTGRPMVPPRWSFGPRRRINRNAMVNGTLETQAMRDAGLAITALDDATHFLPAGDDLGHEQELRDWVKGARALGYRSIAYYNPYFDASSTSANHADTALALQNHWFLEDAAHKPSEVFLISGKPLTVYTIDFTNHDAIDFFTHQLGRAIAVGYAGWMYDFGEYVQPSVLTHSGLSGEAFHNLFPVVYQKAQYDALEGGSLRGDWYAFARSGYTGSSQYVPNAWSGDPDASFSDAEGLPAMVRAGINLGVSGVPHWGSDIGGYKCIADGAAAADGELLARWIELGALSDNMHDEDSCSGGNGPKATIWTSPDAHEAWRTFAQLHTRLFPYLYAVAVEAHATGAPLQRSLWLEHPDHPEWARIDDELYVGPSLLAAPVVKRGARTRDVILPAGRWLDLASRTVLEGDRTVTVDAPLGALPLYLRAGHLVPLLDPSIQTLDDGAAHPGVIGPTEVKDVYDVIGLLSGTSGFPSFTLADGAVLDALVLPAQAIDLGGLRPAASEADLATCDGCYRRDVLPGALVRLRVSATGDVTAGALVLHGKVGRRVRWDLYLDNLPKGGS